MAEPQYYLNLEGIPGESTAPGYAGWIDVLLYSLPGPDSRGSGGASNRSGRENRLTVTMKKGKHSEPLRSANASGQHLATLQFDVVTEGKVQRYLLDDVTVSSYLTQGTIG